MRGLRAYPVWSAAAFNELRQRFHRSVLGPLWLTLSMGILVCALGLVLTTLFKQEIAQTLPYVAVGLICWGLLSSCINEGAIVFISNEAYIRSIPLPLSLHFFRMIARNLIIWVFNMAIYLLMLIYFRIDLGLHFLLFIPGFALFLLNAAWMGLAAGILSTRYRDIPQLLVNVVQVIFFVTPVFWSPPMLAGRPAFVEYNPLYHILELARAPLLGQGISPLSWGFAVGFAVIGWSFTAFLYRWAYARIPYWV